MTIISLPKDYNFASNKSKIFWGGRALFLLYTSEPFAILENKLIGYADDSTFMAIVLSPGVLVLTKTMIVSRSSTMHPELPP